MRSIPAGSMLLAHESQREIGAIFDEQIDRSKTSCKFSGTEFTETAMSETATPIFESGRRLSLPLAIPDSCLTMKNNCQLFHRAHPPGAPLLPSLMLILKFSSSDAL